VRSAAPNPRILHVHDHSHEAEHLSDCLDRICCGVLMFIAVRWYNWFGNKRRDAFDPALSER